MQKNKIDFIADLLADKRIEISLKERAFELASKEVKKVLSVESENLGRIMEIERKMEFAINEMKQAENENKRNKVPIEKKIIKSENSQIRIQSELPNPLHTKQFLSYFRDSEGLKFLTHDFPDLANPIPLSDLMRISRREFNEAKKKYPNTNVKLIRRVEEFAFKPNPKWTIRKGNEEETITFGWSSKPFIEWIENSTVKHPCRSPEWNKKMVEPFKKTIEIRDGLLLEVVEESIKLVFSDDDLELFKIDYDKNNLLLANFFTDVDWFGQALFKIFSGIKNKAEKIDNGNYRISIEFFDNFDGIFKCIKIIHHDSVPRKNSTSTFTDGGDFKEIRNALWNLCNWAIEADFSNGYRRKYLLWDSNIKENDIEIPQNDVKGFTHLLLFY